MSTRQNQGSFTGHPMANNMAPPMPSFGTVIRQGLENGVSSDSFDFLN